MSGIILDTSYWQGPWNFNTAKRRGVRGAILKASGRAVDPMYLGNLKDLRENELEPGAYHYFYPANDIGEQVRMFSDLVNSSFSLGIWLDLEYNAPRYINGKLANLDGKENNPAIIPTYRMRVLEWLEKVEDAVGLRPGVYTNPGHALKYLRTCPELNQYKLWIANPQDKSGTRTVPNVPEPWGGWDWHMWQYSWKGNALYYGGLGKTTGEGWSASVDLNALRD